MKTRAAAIAAAISIIAAANAQEHIIKVFAAASLKEAFSDIAHDIKAARGQDTRFSFDGSQKLAMQLENGAKADIFASADAKYGDSVIHAGLASDSDSKPFASNQMILAVPIDNPAKIFSLNDLRKPGVKLVLAAPSVPAGSYARLAIEKMNAAHGKDFSAEVLANLVSNEENVKKVLAKLSLGEADAGFVYASDIVGHEKSVSTIKIPDDMNVTATYSILILAGANRKQAEDFVEFVLSQKGQAILAKYGFKPPPLPPPSR